VGFEVGEEGADAVGGGGRRVAAAGVMMSRSHCGRNGGEDFFLVVDNVEFFVLVERNFVFSSMCGGGGGGGAIARDAETDLAVKGALFGNGTGEGAVDEGFDFRHVVFAAVGCVFVDAVDMIGIAVLLSQFVGRPDRQHALRHDGGAVSERIGLFHGMRGEEE